MLATDRKPLISSFILSAKIAVWGQKSSAIWPNKNLVTLGLWHPQAVRNQTIVTQEAELCSFLSDFRLIEVIIQSKSIEKDLGILFPRNMKFDEHIDAIVLKANKQLGIIARVFTDKSLKTIVPLCKSFVRPLLEHNLIICSPYTKKNNEKIEKIQKRMLNLVRDLRPLNYQEKLKKAKLFTLQTRRVPH